MFGPEPGSDHTLVLFNTDSDAQVKGGIWVYGDLTFAKGDFVF